MKVGCQLLALIGCLSFEAWAGECSVVLAEKGAKILTQKQGALALPPGHHVDDCAKLSVVEGAVYVLYKTADEVGERKLCKAGAPCEIDQKSRSLFPGYRALTGGKQMEGEGGQLPGVPIGRIFARERAATFDFLKAGIGAWRLSVIDVSTKRPVFQRAGQEPSVQIPLDVLQPGGRYAWTVQGGGQNYSGGFDLLSAKEAEEIKKELGQSAHPGDVGGKVHALVVYKDNGLDYEAGLLGEELGL